MTYQKTITITADHPSFEGHFPGNPVVPGVVLLDEVMNAFSHWREGEEIRAIDSVKFLAVLLPGETFTVLFELSNNNRLKFSCVKANKQLVASGILSEIVGESIKTEGV